MQTKTNLLEPTPENCCAWPLGNPLMQAYHDHEWGKPEHNDQKLFELLCLETYQAGLSWQTVINKRTAFNQRFYDYNVARVAAMTPVEIQAALQDATIIRHRGKLNASVNNAQQVLKIQQEFGSFDAFLWSFVNDEPIINHWQTAAQVPAKSELSEKLAKALRKRGFKFTGPVAMYSFLQGAGLINDHMDWCQWK